MHKSISPYPPPGQPLDNPLPRSTLTIVLGVALVAVVDVVSVYVSVAAIIAVTVSMPAPPFVLACVAVSQHDLFGKGNFDSLELKCVVNTATTAWLTTLRR